MSKIILMSLLLVLILLSSRLSLGVRLVQPLALNYQMNCYGVRSPSRYIRYGCWCGPFNPTGGHKTRFGTVDNLDACCKRHDKCIGEERDRRGYNIFRDSITIYSVTCNSRRTSCDRANTSAFGYHLCRCDRQLASCLARSQNSYSFGNQFVFRCPPERLG